MSIDTVKPLRRSQFAGTITLMAGSAVLISATIIIYFNSLFSGQESHTVGSNIELAATSLVPYLLSALVSAVTAVGIIAIIPLVRSEGSSEVISSRLRQLGCGDLITAVPVTGGNQLEDIVGELNSAVIGLHHNIDQLKVVNRQQWDRLCEIRDAATRGDCAGAIVGIGKMEKGWEKLASIEAKLRT